MKLKLLNIIYTNNQKNNNINFNLYKIKNFYKFNFSYFLI